MENINLQEKDHQLLFKNKKKSAKQMETKDIEIRMTKRKFNTRHTAIII